MHYLGPPLLHTPHDTGTQALPAGGSKGCDGRDPMMRAGANDACRVISLSVASSARRWRAAASRPLAFGRKEPLGNEIACHGPAPGKYSRGTTSNAPSR